MTTAAIASQGTIIRFSDDSGSTWNDIAEVKSFNGPNGQRAEIDVSNFDSVAKEYLGGLTDFGELSLNVNFRPDDTNGQKALIDDTASSTPTTYDWLIVAPDATQHSLSFQGYVKSFQPSANTDGAIEATLAIRVTGAVTLQTGTA